MQNSLPSIIGLKVGIMASINSNGLLSQAASLKSSLDDFGLTAAVIGESLTDGIDVTYTHAYASDFDGIVVTDGATEVFARKPSTLYPLGRPVQIVLDAYRWGKPIGVLGSAGGVLDNLGLVQLEKRQPPQSYGEKNGDESPELDGIYFGDGVDRAFTYALADGLAIFKFTSRFALDE